MSDAVAVVARTAIETYAASDFGAFLDFLTEDITYALFLDQGAIPFAGESTGKPALRERIEQMHQLFEYVLFRPLALRVDGDKTSNQVEFMYRHRASGEVLSGRFRLVLTVRGDRVCRIEEYHDAERVKAFARLVGGI